MLSHGINCANLASFEEIAGRTGKTEVFKDGLPPSRSGINMVMDHRKACVSSSGETIATAILINLFKLEFECNGDIV